MAKRTSARVPNNSASRYAQVKAILDAAAGASTPSYDGVGRFWNLDLEAFKEVCVHGIRMIAPDAEPSCCHPPGSRSADSGLIKGLRGDPPFDGHHFPPLPWGG